MNKEVLRAMNRKESKLMTVRRYWGSAMEVIEIPIRYVVELLREIDTRLNEREFWDNERAEEILNYYIPRKAEWYEKEKKFSLYHNEYGWSYYIAKEHLKFKDRRFWKMHNSFKLRNYLINEFELEGFTKEVGDCSRGWVDVTFKMIEK